jgi:hypothetical protein
MKNFLLRDIPALVLTLISIGLFVTCAIVTTTSLSGDTKPSTTDWISAWATVASSIGTAGALLVGTFTLLRQVQDHHRAQASRVIVRVEESKDENSRPTAIVSNLSDLPIYKVTLRVDPWDVFGDSLEKTEPVLVGDMEPLPIPEGYLEQSVQVQFQDTSGTTWIRWASGGLAENIGKKDVEFHLIE